MSITIPSSPATFDNVYVYQGTNWTELTFAIPAGIYSAALWATTASVTGFPKGLNAEIATDGTTPGHTVLLLPEWVDTESGYVMTSAATSAQLGDINAAAGSSLAAWWQIYGQDFGSATADVSQCLLILTPCTYAVSPGSASYDLTGGSGDFTVTTESLCPWTAISDSSWLHVTSGSPGQGNGTVDYSVDSWANPCSESSTRVGNITLPDGTAFTVTQTGCSYSVSPTSGSYPWGGGSGSASVTAQSTCPWTAVSHDDWITLTAGASGTGDGTVSYEVAAQAGLSGSERTGTITVACQTVTISQNGLFVGGVDLQSLPSPDNHDARQFLTVTFPSGYIRTDLTPVAGEPGASFDACRPRSQYLAYIQPAENAAGQLVVTDNTGAELANGTACPPVDIWRERY